MTALTPHLGDIELEGAYEAAAGPVAKSHFHALWLVPRGYAVAEVARLPSFSARWVHTLIKRCNGKGPPALAGPPARQRRGPAHPHAGGSDGAEAADCLAAR